jgi:nucleotide-binding universal stress UspA family protein
MTEYKYPLDNAWQAARERLAMLEAVWDPLSVRCLGKVGVVEGWRCLEVGGIIMFRSLLVPLNGSEGDITALETAYLVARPFSAHIQCVYFSSAWSEIAAEVAAADAAMPSAELYAALEEERRKTGEWAHRHFAEFCQRRSVAECKNMTGARSVSAHMHEIRGEAGNELIWEGHFHDLIVLARTPGGRGFGSTLIGVGRPVMLAPEHEPETVGSTVAIAWKKSAEAARALTAAMPLLTKSGKVIVFAADEGAGRDATIGSAERIARHLRDHDLAVEIECVDVEGQSTANAIVQSALAKKSDLLVMGAYGHSRVRELILGGMTREVLIDCPIPVFLFH